jgi:hypothetical protein
MTYDITTLKSLLKAGPLGKKDITKLRREVITNKKGVRTIVYKKNGEEPKKNSILDTIMEFFGFKSHHEVTSHIKKVYDEHGIQKEHGLSAAEFANHFTEYFKHKARWDAKFTGTKLESGKKKEPGKEGEKKTGGGGEEKSREKKNWNPNVMKVLHGLYGNGKPAGKDQAKKSITVHNLSTGEKREYQGITPHEAVVAAHESSQGRNNTWEYKDKLGNVQEGEHSVAMGDWAALKDKDKAKAAVAAAGKKDDFGNINQPNSLTDDQIHAHVKTAMKLGMKTLERNADLVAQQVKMAEAKKKGEDTMQRLNFMGAVYRVAQLALSDKSMGKDDIVSLVDTGADLQRHASSEKGGEDSEKYSKELQAVATKNGWETWFNKSDQEIHDYIKKNAEKLSGKDYQAFHTFIGDLQRERDAETAGEKSTPAAEKAPEQPATAEDTAPPVDKRKSYPEGMDASDFDPLGVDNEKMWSEESYKSPSRIFELKDEKGVSGTKMTNLFKKAVRLYATGRAKEADKVFKDFNDPKIDKVLKEHKHPLAGNADVAPADKIRAFAQQYADHLKHDPVPQEQGKPYKVGGQGVAIHGNESTVMQHLQPDHKKVFHMSTNDLKKHFYVSKAGEEAGVFTDAKFLLMDDPAKMKKYYEANRKKLKPDEQHEIEKEYPNWKQVIPDIKKVNSEYADAEVVAGIKRNTGAGEFHDPSVPGEAPKPAVLRVKDGEGKGTNIMVDSKYIAAIRSHYPNATFRAQKGNAATMSPLAAVNDGKVVGVIMPIQAKTRLNHFNEVLKAGGSPLDLLKALYSKPLEFFGIRI